MKIIDVITENGTTLYGCFYGDASMETCVIITNGTCGNIFENKFLRILGDNLEKQNVAFVYAHNSGAFQILDLRNNKTNSNIRTGFAYEDFEQSFFDLDAYVKWAENIGFKQIIIGGHSLGANKVVNYLSQTKNKSIVKYILISPTDTKYLMPSEKEEIPKFMEIALNNIKNNEPEKILPELYDDYNVFSSKTFLDYINNSTLNNLPVFQKEKDFSQLQKIDVSGLFVMGEKDSFGGGNTLEFLQTINKNSKNMQNDIKVIKNCGHTFRNKEIELYDIIFEFVKS